MDDVGRLLHKPIVNAMNWNIVEETLNKNNVSSNVCTLCVYMQETNAQVDNEITEWLIKNYNTSNEYEKNIMISLLNKQPVTNDVLLESFSVDEINREKRKLRYAEIQNAVYQCVNNISENYVIISDALDNYFQEKDIPKMNHIDSDEKFAVFMKKLTMWLEKEKEIINIMNCHDE